MNILAASEFEKLKACMEDPMDSGEKPRPEAGAAMKSAQGVKDKIQEAHDAVKKHAAAYQQNGGNMGANMHLNNAASHLQDAFHSLGKANTAHEFASGFQKK